MIFLYFIKWKFIKLAFDWFDKSIIKKSYIQNFDLNIAYKL